MKRTTTSRRKRWFFARAMARAYREMLEKRRRKRPGSKNAKAATQRPLFAEALEPRVLFSGTPAPAETDTEAEDQNQEAAQTAEMLDGLEDADATFDGIPEAGLDDLEEEDVERLAQEAIARWEASGLTDEQIAALADVEYIIDDLGGSTLGYVDGMTVYLDDDAAGYDWFIDDTEWLDEEFVEIDGLLQAELGEDGDAWIDAGEGVDLLSVIMHEQGHIVGLLDDFSGEDEGDIMHGLFREGERRLIDEDRAEGAIAGSLEGIHLATISGTAGGNDSWNDASNWDTGVPTGTDDAIIAAGVTVQITNAPPAYSGSLVLNDNSTLQLRNRNAIDVLQTPADITLNTDSTLDILDGSPTFGDIELTGDANITLRGNGAHHETVTFGGTISGNGGLLINGVNNDTFHLNAANTFAGGFVAQSDANQGFRVEANVSGAFGGGNVTINNAATLQIDAANVIADGATLNLNGVKDSRRAAKLILNSNDTVGGFFIDGVDQGFGDFSSSTHPGIIGGSGVLTVPVPAVQDFDGDGFDDVVDLGGGLDANDADDTIFPNAPELPDLKDNDQDGTVDEGLAPVNRMTSTDGGDNSWSLGANWTIDGTPFGTDDFNHMPGANDSAIVGAGLTAQVNLSPFDFAGSLTLEDNSTVQVNNRSAINILESPSDIVLNDGSSIVIRDGSPTLGPIEVIGMTDIGFSSNGAHHETLNFDGIISGTGSLELVGVNNDTFRLNNTNTFAGGFTAGGSQTHRVQATATGAFGTGDVTINDRVALYVEASNTIADSATLTLNGTGATDPGTGEPVFSTSNNDASKLILSVDETVGGLMINGAAQADGTYGAIGSGADNEVSWITGGGVLTVLPVGPVTLIDEGFQDPAYANNTANPAFAGWTTDGKSRTAAGTPDVPVDTAGDNSNQLIQFEWTSQTATYDISHDWEAGKAFTLTLNASPQSWNGTQDRFINPTIMQDDGTVLWTTSSKLPAYDNFGRNEWTAAQTFEYVILTDNFTAGAAGESISLKLQSSGFRGMYVDNVHLTVGDPPDDTTAPNPNALTWDVAPTVADYGAITMTATTASDPAGVEYFFENTTPGATNNSGWQDSATWVETGLDPDTTYTYRVQARDKSSNQNTGEWSTVESATTPAVPAGTIIATGFEAPSNSNNTGNPNFPGWTLTNGGNVKSRTAAGTSDVPYNVENSDAEDISGVDENQLIQFEYTNATATYDTQHLLSADEVYVLTLNASPQSWNGTQDRFINPSLLTGSTGWTGNAQLPDYDNFGRNDFTPSQEFTFTVPGSDIIANGGVKGSR